jgi:hypothetical protein
MVMDNTLETVFLLLALFGIKHFICDFWLQFPYMLSEKGVYGAEGGRHHALMHTAGTFLVLAVCIPSIEWAVVFAFVDGLVHYHIDWVKTNIAYKYTPADDQFWFWLGLDQTLHYLTYIAIIATLFLI